jgi:hypothetical protein
MGLILLLILLSPGIVLTLLYLPVVILDDLDGAFATRWTRKRLLSTLDPEKHAAFMAREEARIEKLERT